MSKFKIGTVLDLTYNTSNNSAIKGAKCIVVDGAVEFPEYFIQLSVSFDIEQFVAVIWDKNHARYVDAEDGFYSVERFKVSRDQIDFRRPFSVNNLKNNENRKNCFVCGKETVTVQGFITNYTICPVCRI